MNVVGKVGSLITQGVYSVATPFHPFGGAVDVIVVQQQDGSFRSTPWYVRFGKFQGVLKGAEKVVQISVNGVEANFHMYLDNSGEAYFIREVESGKEGHNNGNLKDSCAVDIIHEEGSSVVDSDNNDVNVSEVCRLEHSVSDSGMEHLREEHGALSAIGLQRAESDGDRRYYDFQDEQSSIENSVGLSEFDPNRYEKSDGDRAVEQHGSDSEVILMSVDGHVLTAPVSTSEENVDVQLSTPQFHLGPGEGTEELIPEDDSWASDYISKLDVPTSTAESSSVSAHHLMVCEGNGEHVCQDGEIQNILEPKDDIQLQSDLEDTSTRIKKEVFKSCLELSELAESAAKDDVEVIASPQGVDESNESSLELSELAESATKDDVKVIASPLGIEESKESCLELSESIESAVKADVEVNASKQWVEESKDVPLLIPVVGPDADEGIVEFRNESLSPPCTSNPSENEGSVNFANESLSQPRTSYPNENEDLKCANERTTPLLVSESTASEAPELEEIENKALEIEKTASNSSFEHSVGFNEDAELNNEGFSASVSTGDLDSSLQISKDRCSESEIVEPQKITLRNDMQTDSNFGFEVSLCGKELRAGLGVDEANKVFEAHRVSAEEFKNSSKSIIKNGNLIIRYKERFLPWEKAAPFVLGKAAFGLDLDVELKDAIPVEQNVSPQLRDDDAVSTPSSSSSRRWRLWPNPFRRVKTLDHCNSNSSSEDLFLDTESGIQSSTTEPNFIARDCESPRKQFVRTNVPTSEQVASLKLKDGQNTITFSFSTRVLGTQQVEAHIYLWKWNARIVISDVDGTITKSDVLGQFMPLVGKDWSQSGVANLFSAIKENGYQLLFLSARAIVQAYLTKSFLFNLKQDGKTLPTGPVVISPDGLFPSLYREVIRRAPHEFKIACLEDIRRLFPADYNPFYAGFGNRDTDELSYRKIGIPKGKIFIINPKGEVAISHRIDVRSYTSLHTLVNDMFPPTSLVEQEDYNSWNFWRMPLPDME